MTFICGFARPKCNQPTHPSRRTLSLLFRFERKHITHFCPDLPRTVLGSTFPPLLFAKRVATREICREEKKRLQATPVQVRTAYLQPRGHASREPRAGERNATNQIKGRNDANNINLGITSPGSVDQKPVLSLHQVKVEHSRS